METAFQRNLDDSDFKVLPFSHPESGTFQGVQTVSPGADALFAITVQPTLNLIGAANHALLTWNNPPFSLYSSTSIIGTITNILGAASPYPNTITGSQRFFRRESH
jgi:hypothetical protein